MAIPSGCRPDAHVASVGSSPTTPTMKTTIGPFDEDRAKRYLEIIRKPTDFSQDQLYALAEYTWQIWKQGWYKYSDVLRKILVSQGSKQPQYLNWSNFVNFDIDDEIMFGLYKDGWILWGRIPSGELYHCTTKIGCKCPPVSSRYGHAENI